MRFALLAAALAIAACGNPSGPAVSYSTVSVVDTAYAPDTVTIAAGAGVRWTNLGPSGHTVTPDTGAAFGATLGAPGMDAYGYPTAGGSYSKVFATAGTYAYHCNFHAAMHGVVVVTP
jgi:plastocyanin